MTRISIKDLESRVNRINELTNSPLKPYERIDGKLIAQIGNYHLEQAYGGIKLCRMVTEGGGNQNISQDGYGTKKQLYAFLNAFITGLELKGYI